jgi:DNA-binding HxlR family transcriptional regulator
MGKYCDICQAEEAIGTVTYDWKKTIKRITHEGRSSTQTDMRQTYDICEKHLTEQLSRFCTPWKNNIFHKMARGEGQD